MNLSDRQKRFLHYALIAVFAAVAVTSAAYNGIPFGNDLTQHYQFAASVQGSLARGEIYPSLSPLANGGLGDYGIRFYPPLGYYLLAISFGITGSWFGGSLLAFFTIFFLGGTGVYLWALEEFTPRRALMASALFVLAPYHLNQIYNSFLYGEFAASAVIPFCFLFVHRAAVRPSAVTAAGLAAAYAVLILTHLPSLIFCSIAFAIYGLVILYWRGEYLRPLAALASGVAVSVVSTSFYWIKLISEMGWINHSKPEYFSNVLGYASNLLLRPANIINIQTDSQTVWIADLMLFVTAVICIPTVIVLIKQRTLRSPIIAGSLAVMITGMFMASVLSKPVWDLLPFLQKMQFPWRWLGVVAVSAAIFSSYGVDVLSDKTRPGNGRLASVALAFAAVVFTVSAVFIVKQPAFSPAADFTDPKVRNMLTAQSRDCWWPIWTKEGFYRKDRKKAEAGARSVQVVRWDTVERVLRIGPGSETLLRPAILYYPHWRAYIDGERTGVSRDSDGLLTVQIPERSVEVTLRFREPDKVRAAAAVSAAGWATILFVLVFGYIRRSGNPTPSGGEENPKLEE